MPDVQIAVIDQQDTQIVLAVPGVQGATGSSIPAGGTADRVLRKNSSTDYDTNWSQVTSAMIANGAIVDEDVNNGAAIAGTKISPNFGGQAVTTTGQVNAARVNVTGNTAPTNGLYLPGTNQVALSTNGTGRLFVDASGNLGLGEASNGERFRLVTSATQTNMLVLQSAGGTFALRTQSTGGGESVINVFQGSASATAVPFVIQTGSQERLRITSAGLVGIGTSLPSRKLHIGGTNPGDSLIRQDATTGGTNWEIGEREAGKYQWWEDDNDQVRMTLTSQGRLGIGVTSPARKVHIHESSAADLIVQYTNATTGAAVGDGFQLQVLAADGQVDFNQRENAALTFKTNTTERARIDSSGRLLVGTVTSPAYQLQLETDSAGKPSTNTWTIVSDERIKEEIELADLDLCYEAIKNIPLKRFKWKDEVYTEEQAYDRRKLGWIAQDVEAVFPKAVRQHEFRYNQVFEEVVIPAVPAELDDDGNIITEEQPERIEKGELISEEVIEDCRDLNSDQLYAAMYGAIQKLISKVELLETEVQALKAA